MLVLTHDAPRSLLPAAAAAAVAVDDIGNSHFGFSICCSALVLGPIGSVQYYLMWLQSTNDDMTDRTEVCEETHLVYSTESKHNAIASSRNSIEMSFK